MQPGQVELSLRQEMRRPPGLNVTERQSSDVHVSSRPQALPEGPKVSWVSTRQTQYATEAMAANITGHYLLHDVLTTMNHH
jgi:hypothetical protein